MADLYKRLKAIREREGHGGKPLTAANPKPPASVVQSPPPADSTWTRVCPLVWQRRQVFELTTGWVTGLGPQAGNLVEAAINQDIRFIDTETTGLSGGAGTWIFLAGWSRLIRAAKGVAGQDFQIEISQFFLEDLGGEADFVGALTAGLAGSGKLVSYNGSSFDLPLLRTRWIMNGRQFPDLPHQDCLHPARRFWKALHGGASLGQIERSVLGIFRRDDIPGALVPALYLEYLRRGAGPGFETSLGGVMEHHAQDMANLARLWLLIGCVAAAPLDDRWRPIWPDEMASLAACVQSDRMVIGSMPGDPGRTIARPLPVHARALASLLDEVQCREWSLAAWQSSHHPEWGRLAARCCKQAARSARDPADKTRWYRTASEIWLELWQQVQAIDALVELLKYREHQAGADGKALAWELVQEALRHPVAQHPVLGVELQRRAERLNRGERFTGPSDSR